MVNDHERGANVAEANVPMTEGLRHVTRLGPTGDAQGKQLEVYVATNGGLPMGRSSQHSLGSSTLVEWVHYL